MPSLASSLLSLAVAAALFFRPLVGIAATAVAVVALALVSFVDGSQVSIASSFSLLVVGLVATAVRKWFLDGKRPDLVQSLLFGVVAEILYLSVVVLTDRDVAGCCELVLGDFVSGSAARSSLLVLLSLVTRSAGGPGTWLRSWTSRLMGVYLLFAGVQVGLSTVESFRDAADRGSDARRRLEYVFASQIDFMLHHDAVEVVESLGKLRPLSEAEASAIAESARYDEICLVNPQGRIESCNNARLKVFDFSAHETTRKYLALVNDPNAYIGEPFRKSELEPVEVKYGGVGFPDGSGFIQFGYYRKRLERDFLRYFAPIFHQQIGYASGDYYLVVWKPSEKIIVADLEHDALEGRIISECGFGLDSEYVRLFGEWSLLRSRDIGDYRVFCVIPLNAIFFAGLYLCAVLLLLLFVFVFAIRLVMVRFRRQQRKIDQMRAEADERQRKDMDMAARIQSSSLPTTFPQDEGYSFFAKMKPAREVGGDFFDIYQLLDGRIVFTIADVSGKGVPAALFMMKAKGTLKSAMFRCADPAAAVANANERLVVNNEAEMFVTSWIGVFDPAARTVDFVNAGHNPPLVKRADGSVEFIRTRGGTALGVFPNCRYRPGRITLAPGDSLLLYTDGVTEAQDAHGGFYGEDRLKRFLTGAGSDFVAGLFADLAAFADAAEQADDITALVLDIRS